VSYAVEGSYCGGCSNKAKNQKYNIIIIVICHAKEVYKEKIEVKLVIESY